MKPYRILSSVFAILILTACSGNEVKENLGFERQAPDEFRVVSRPPLSVPPEFKLRPPTPGDNSSYQTPASQEAKAAVMGSGSVAKPSDVTDADRTKASDTAVPVVRSAELPSTADTKFLSNVGADKSDPSIRQKLYEDAAKPAPAAEQESLMDSIWPKKEKPPVVDAKKEAERIEKNKEENKPVTEGDTPIQKTKDRGVLDRIWNDD